MQLLVVIFLHGYLQDGVVLGVPLLGHSLEVAVGSSTQALQGSMDREGRGEEGRGEGGEGEGEGGGGRGER